ncbi:hypothetical protein NKI74_21400 [Mesorhizobium sp. M0494]|uniref:hypothetical protein n=1 Tax=Mesorhizobium sp. M0494 TaxID=2956951 RepID=UPI00333D012C
MNAALAVEVRRDITFGEYASLFGFIRSTVMHESRLLELAIGQAVQKNPDLKLLPTTAMPIVPVAQEMLKREPSDEIKGVRFPSRVHSNETYKPDLFAVNRTKHSGNPGYQAEPRLLPSSGIGPAAVQDAGGGGDRAGMGG